MFVLPAEQQSVDIEFIGKCTYRKFIVFGKALVVRRRRNSSGLLSIQISVWTAEHDPNQLTDYVFVGGISVCADIPLVQRRIGIDMHTDCFTFCILLRERSRRRTHGRCRAV